MFSNRHVRLIRTCPFNKFVNTRLYTEHLILSRFYGIRVISTVSYVLGNTLFFSLLTNNMDIWDHLGCVSFF